MGQVSWQTILRPRASMTTSWRPGVLSLNYDTLWQYRSTNVIVDNKTQTYESINNRVQGLGMNFNIPNPVQLCRQAESPQYFIHENGNDVRFCIPSQQFPENLKVPYNIFDLIAEKYIHFKSNFNKFLSKQQKYAVNQWVHRTW